MSKGHYEQEIQYEEILSFGVICRVYVWRNVRRKFNKYFLEECSL